MDTNMLQFHWDEHPIPESRREFLTLCQAATSTAKETGICETKEMAGERERERERAPEPEPRSVVNTLLHFSVLIEW